MSETRKEISIRELLFILEACDPEGRVALDIPAFMPGENDAPFTEEGLGILHDVDFDVASCFLAKSYPPEGTKPNHVRITVDYLSAYKELSARRDALRQEAQSQGPAYAMSLIEPAIADADNVILDLKLSRELHQNIRKVLWGLNLNEQGGHNPASTHGLLTPEVLLVMLAEDVGKTLTQCESRESKCMEQIFAAHGYSY